MAIYKHMLTRPRSVAVLSCDLGVLTQSSCRTTPSLPSLGRLLSREYVAFC